MGGRSLPWWIDREDRRLVLAELILGEVFQGEVFQGEVFQGEVFQGEVFQGEVFQGEDVTSIFDAASREHLMSLPGRLRAFGRDGLAVRTTQRTSDAGEVHEASVVRVTAAALEARVAEVVSRHCRYFGLLPPPTLAFAPEGPACGDLEEATIRTD